MTVETLSMIRPNTCSDAGTTELNDIKLPIHLSRFAGECLNADYDDASARAHIKNCCMPYLGQHRRELLAGSFAGRHKRPAGYLAAVRQKAKLIRGVLAHAHLELSARERSNVVSFAEAFRGRAA